MGRMIRKWLVILFHWNVTVSHIPDSETDHFAGLLFLSSTCMLCISERHLEGDTAICVKILGWTAQQPEEEKQHQFLISDTVNLKFFLRKGTCKQSHQQFMFYFCLKSRTQVMHTWLLVPMTGLVVLCTAVFHSDSRFHPICSQH